MVKKKEVFARKEGRIKKGHHVAKKKHSYPRLILLLVLLVFLGLIVLPVLFQEKVTQIPESIPILKPSPPLEEEEVPVEEFPEDIEEVEPVVKSSKKEVVIKRDSLEPDKVVIEEGTIVSWVNDDSRRHKIVCYINKRRIFVGEILFNKGDKSEYKFKDSGEYLCLDAVFGLRMSVIVKPMSLSRITGGVVRNILTESVVLVGILVFVILLAVSVSLYVNKRT